MSEEAKNGLGPEFDRAAAEAEALAEEMRGAGEGQAQPGQEAGATDAAEAVKLSNAETIAMMMGMARAAPFITKRFPHVAGCFTDEVIAENSQAVGAAMDKYGASFGGLDAWAIEIRALVAVGSLAWAVSEALAVDMQEKRAQAAKPVDPVESSPIVVERPPQPEGSYCSAVPG